MTYFENSNQTESLFVHGRLKLIRRLMVCLCVLTGALWLAPLATAAECGGSAGGGEPLAGTLLLRTEQSTSELSFKRDKEDRRLILVFDVKECTLPADAKIEVKMRSSELEVGSVFGDPEVEPEGSVLTVEVPVDPEAFDAGTHSASMTLRGSEITPTTSKVLVQRTEPLPLPILILLVLVAIGFVWAVLVCGAQLKTRKAAIAFGFSFVAAGAVWWASYGQSEVWELELETVGAMAIGAVPAAYGAATRVFQGKKENKDEGQG